MFFTAGFGYSFFDKRLNDYYQPFGLDEFSGYYHDTVSQPLVNQPGEVWEYGVNIDCKIKDAVYKGKTDLKSRGWPTCRTRNRYEPQRLLPGTHLQAYWGQEH
jgi:hypothetical protein